MFEDLTFLIPTRNRTEDLHMAIERTCSAGLGDAMFLVYDDSSDDPRQTERAASVAPRHKVVRGNPRRGQAWARNRLAELCTTRWFFLMDDDCSVVRPGRLGALLENQSEASAEPGVAVYAPQIVRTYDGLRWFPGGVPGQHIASFLGGGALVDRERFLAAGGFRNWFVYRCEEDDLGARLFRHGWNVVFEPSILVEHWHTPAARNSSEYDYLSARNTILLHYLNFPGFWGFPAGLLRGIRLMAMPGASRTATVRGVVAGVVCCYRRRHERSTMSREQFRQYWRLRTRRRPGTEAEVMTGEAN